MLEQLKKLDHYRQSVLAALPIALALLITLIYAHASALLLDSWFLDLITIPLFVGNLVASSTYLGRLFDFTKKDFPVRDDDPVQPGRKRERIGTFIGVLLGLAAGIILIFAHAPVPFAPTLCAVANILFVLNRINIFAGLGSRIGSCVDTVRPLSERHAIVFATILGVAIGIALFLTSSAAAITIAGITTVMSSGLTLPLWASGIVFIGTFTSALVSFADYTSKAVIFLTEKKKNSAIGRMIRKERFHEYRGSCLGVLSGLGIGAAAVVLLALSQPQLFIGAAGVVAAALIIATCVSACGGLCSRVGRLGDGLFSAPTTQQPITRKKVLAFTSTLKIKHQLRQEKPVTTLTAMPKSVTESKNTASPNVSLSITSLPKPTANVLPVTPTAHLPPAAAPIARACSA